MSNKEIMMEILADAADIEYEYGSFKDFEVMSAYDGCIYNVAECVKLDGVGWVNRDQLAHYYYCENCHKYHELDNPDNEPLETVDGDFICSSCFRLYSKFKKCEDCGLIIDVTRDYYRTAGDSYYCESCATDYSTCDGCGQLLVYDDYHEFRGMILCNSCYEAEKEEVIHGYGHTRPNRFYKLDDEEPTKEFFGIELEIGNGGSDNIDVAEYAYDMIDNLVECKADSSIDDGFEIVTMPMTYKKHMSYRDSWARFMDYAEEEGFESNEYVNCGMHVHVSRNAFGKNTEEEDDNIDKLLYIFEGFWENVKEFSRRSNDQINDWCNRYLSGKNKINKKLVKEKKKEKSGSRYMAINLTNSATVEFRIFNGTLDIVTFCANLQLVKRLMDIVTTMSDEEIMELTWNDIINGDSEYIDLIKYYKTIGTIDDNIMLKEIFTDKIMPKLCLPKGTKLRIRSDIKAGMYYASIYCNNVMAKPGSWLTLDEDVLLDDVESSHFKCRFGADRWYWNMHMFEAVEFPIGAKLTPRKDIVVRTMIDDISYLDQMKCDSVTLKGTVSNYLKMTNGYAYAPMMLVEYKTLNDFWESI